MKAAVAMCSLAAIVAGTAHGSIVSFVSVPEYSDPGFYTGTMDYACPGKEQTLGTLTVTLNNTTSLENEGWLTGFAFNIVPSVTLALTSGLSGWGGMSGVNGTGFGQPYDFGAGVGGVFNGVPNNDVDLGIAAGASGTFEFSVAGDLSTLCSLTSASFFDDSKDYALVARFMKFAHGNAFSGGDNEDRGNAKIPAQTPAPGALALLALSSIASRRRQR
jgi:hypothetical protein